MQYHIFYSGNINGNIYFWKLFVLSKSLSRSVPFGPSLFSSFSRGSGPQTHSSTGRRTKLCGWRISGSSSSTGLKPPPTNRLWDQAGESHSQRKPTKIFWKMKAMDHQNQLPFSKTPIRGALGCWIHRFKGYFENEHGMNLRGESSPGPERECVSTIFLVKIQSLQHLPCVAQRETSP